MFTESMTSEFRHLDRRVKTGFYIASAAALGLAYLLANHHHLIAKEPTFTVENGRKGFRAPGYRVAQSELDPTIVQIVNIPSSILDTNALARGREKLVELCGDVKVVPLRGAEEKVWEARVPQADNCLSTPTR